MNPILRFLPVAGALGLFAFGMVGAKQPKNPTAIVTFYLSTECPVAAAYTPRINSLVEEFKPKGVQFASYFPNAADSRSKVEAYVRERNYSFSAELDLGGEKARANKVEIVPTVVVRSADGALLYRGAIDDSKYADAVRRPYLREALLAVANGKSPTVAETKPVGCIMDPGPPVPTLKEVNYSEHVAAILNDHCVTCHRPGQVGPFSMVGYQNAKNWSNMIAEVTGKGTMPPWKAAPGVGEFKQENRLSDREVAVLRQWAQAGAPQGDPKKAPKPPTFKSDWALGKPDMVVSMPESFDLGPDGRDEYWNFVITPDIKKPVWIQAMDVQPGNRRVVHHVIAFLDSSGRARKMAAAGRSGGYKTSGGGIGVQPDNSLGGWAPGLVPSRFPEDAGFLLKPGTDIVLQVHYNKSGKPEKDLTKVALYFNKGKVQNSVKIAWLANPLIRIPAGESDHRVKQTIPIPADVRLYSLMPHMHLTGKSMRATLVKPDGSELPLIDIPAWDFNWQLMYQLRSPLDIDKGSKIVVEAVYDNSAGNPNNPNDPPKTLHWGEQTTDEMMLLVAAISVRGQDGWKEADF
ncbi:MAG: redoxin domain-containing protein [Fimbriimonadaceae bacterium]|nr:redoxin domain-containing protein [Fimbriimonadaceae bacterium]QYK54872.1 MAG: redoxin domain-containing protein [Fimbriimonadaceae bacterium]